MPREVPLTETRAAKWFRFGATVAIAAFAWASITTNVSTLKDDREKMDATIRRIESKLDEIGHTVVQNAADTRVTFADVRAQIEIIKAQLSKDGR